MELDLDLIQSMECAFYIVIDPGSGIAKDNFCLTLTS